MIFKDALAKNLEVGERCETDRGYRGSAPVKVKCPGGLLADPDPAVKDGAGLRVLRARAASFNGSVTTSITDGIYAVHAVLEIRD
jgi:hypothetical protein